MAGKYGLRVKDADGNITLDTADWLFRIRYDIVAASDSGGSVVLADISGKTTELVSISLEDGKLAHSVSRATTTISWTAQTSGAGSYSYASASSLIIVLITD